ncbi:hypothetical protein Q8F55_001374 [Vanrija albida]|uniref:Amino acid permease/ SLC12A domain-containing protein n=1 Tax=Vanrija albida TaxID=181172 RepID=A0ABR3QFU2_9TREE
MADHEKEVAHVKVDHVEGEVPLERNFSFWACFGLGFALLNSWTDVLAPQGKKNGLSFFVGWMSAAGWTSLTATNSFLSAQFVTGLIALWHPTFDVAAWQTLLIYLAFLAGAYLLNTFCVRALPHMDHFAGFWSMGGIVVVAIVVLACSSGKFNEPKDVFATFTNNTGWPDGVAFLLGLLQSTFGLTAFDAVTHMIEEMPRPSINAPKVMIVAVLLGSVTAWIFMICILFCIRDFDAVLTAATGPILQIYYQVTSNRIGATCLLMFNLLGMAFAAEIVMTVSSRIILTFARDRGLGHLSATLAPVHPTLKVPVFCIIFVVIWDIAFGLINLGSTAALNAILGSSVVFLQISYFVPILLIFLRGDRAFEGHDAEATYSLGRWRRPINLFALVFLLVTSVMFTFPPNLPVSGTSMSYVSVVLAIALVLCAVTWVVDGRKRFNGPGELMTRLEISKNA